MDTKSDEILKELCDTGIITLSGDVAYTRQRLNKAGVWVPCKAVRYEGKFGRMKDGTVHAADTATIRLLAKSHAAVPATVLKIVVPDRFKQLCIAAGLPVERVIQQWMETADISDIKE